MDDFAFTPPTADGHPAVLTVEEAGRILRVSRSTAYALAKQWLTTDGAEGLPVHRIGRQLRVSWRELEDFLGGPISWPIAGFGAATGDPPPERPAGGQTPRLRVVPSTPPPASPSPHSTTSHSTTSRVTSPSMPAAIVFTVAGLTRETSLIVLGVALLCEWWRRGLRGTDAYFAIPIVAYVAWGRFSAGRFGVARQLQGTGLAPGR